VIDFVPPVLAIDMWPLVQGLVMTLFVLCSLLMLLVILIQEGKGGGIAGAFGGAAAETFGVKAGTVNRFTAILAAIFMGLALVHAGIASATGGSVIPLEPPPPRGAALPGPGSTPPPSEAPGSPDGEEPPAGMTETPPAMDDAPAMDGAAMDDAAMDAPAMDGDAAMDEPAMGDDAAMGSETPPAPPTPPAEKPAPSMGG
jgi:preprotein translocase subunit SecG